MKQIIEIGNDAKQIMTVILENNDVFTFNLDYRMQQFGWYYNIVYGEVFSTINERLVLGNNIIRKYKNLIPFGLAIKSTDGVEPMFLDDLSGNNPRISIYLLTSAEVDLVEKNIYSK